MANPNLEPAEIRIVKKKKISGRHHGGAWKVAYADFVTAMMALFIVLWIMSQSQSIRIAVAQYFKNPGLLPGAMSLMETSDMGGKMPTPGHSQEWQTPSPIPPETAQDRDSLEEVKKRLEEMIAQLPELQKLKDQVLLEITSEGLRIELLERENSNFFDIGSANLKAETKKILNLIAQELGGLPNQVTVEGHTDSRPYGTQNYTNWELSTDRANAARRLMEISGLNSRQILAVRGFADRYLRNPQDPLDFQNRRVTIIVMFQDKSPGGPRLLKPIPDPKDRFPAGPQGAEAASIPGKPADENAASAGPSQILSDELKQKLQPLQPQSRLGW
ncbi:MAG: OmpA family protein [Deltaproteobacteria bacterium]|nr:OmpA family protein [Deltaproteobacteria bacterium]